MIEVESLICGERLKAAWTGEFWDQTIGVYSKFSPLDSGGKIEVKLSAEPLLDKLIICRYQAQSGILVWKEITFAILLVGGLPFLSLFLVRKILFWRIVGFGVGRKAWFWSGERRRV